MPKLPPFTGEGTPHDDPWRRSESGPAEDDPLRHPRHYFADP
jgi:hypothetical protein